MTKWQHVKRVGKGNERDNGEQGKLDLDDLAQKDLVQNDLNQKDLNQKDLNQKELGQQGDDFGALLEAFLAESSVELGEREPEGEGEDLSALLVDDREPAVKEKVVSNREPVERSSREKEEGDEDWSSLLAEDDEEKGRVDHVRKAEYEKKAASVEQDADERRGERDGSQEPKRKDRAAEDDDDRAQPDRQDEPKKASGSKKDGDNAAPGTNGDTLEPIPEHIENFVERLKQDAGYETSFDIIVREMTLGGKKTAFFMLNGLASGIIMTEILQRLTFLQADSMSTHALESFMHLYVPAVQATKENDWNMMMTSVLSGSTGMYIDGESTMLIMDAKSFPVRNPEEPSLEKVVRGSRDGFVETLLTNVSLVRRRLRDPKLRLEVLRVGERTRSDVCISYIDDIVDKELLESIRDKISAVKLDGLPLADKQLEEATVKRGWNPYPLVRYSERPDVVAAQLLEGSVAVFVDTSPSVMILPTTFFDLVQHAEENRQTPFIGTYLRWVRFIGIIASLFLVPMWLLFAVNPQLLPPELAFIGPAKMSKLPLVLQFLLAEGGIDLMRMAAIHTPTPLAMAISLISAILVGDIAVQTGLFINEVIIYMAVAAIGMFATPSYELSLANRIVRLILICLVAAFNIPGLVVGWTVVFVVLVTQRSFNRPYMWPFIPFDFRGMLNIVFRMPVMQNRKRPNLLRPQQQNKMPETEGS